LRCIQLAGGSAFRFDEARPPLRQAFFWYSHSPGLSLWYGPNFSFSLRNFCGLCVSAVNNGWGNTHRASIPHVPPPSLAVYKLPCDRRCLNETTHSLSPFRQRTSPPSRARTQVLYLTDEKPDLATDIRRHRERENKDCMNLLAFLIDSDPCLLRVSVTLRRSCFFQHPTKRTVPKSGFLRSPKERSGGAPRISN